MMKVVSLTLCSAAVLAISAYGTAQAQTQTQTENAAEIPAPAAPSENPAVQADIQMVQPPAPQAETAAPQSVITVTEGSPDGVVPVNPDVPPAVPLGAEGSASAAMVGEPVLGTPIEKEINEQILFQRPSVDVNTIPSLFFSRWEHDAIIDARNSLNTRPPDEILPENNAAALDAPRDISLGGIVYHSKKEWTIWLNAKRITPDAIPNEIIDLKVGKDYIELEWFDAKTNQIYPIRLRTHQRFNLDARIFLPG